jgi:dCMP deaminase
MSVTDPADKHAAAAGERRRVSWNRYFMNLAVQAATRSTCPRKSVGAVIVRDKTVLSTGYNGSLRGAPHCDEAGCLMEGGHCVRTVHAEANALVQAARHGVRLEGAEIYVTASPCFNCFKLIVNAGIRTVYYGEFYRDEQVLRFAQELGIALVDLGLEDEDPAAQ